MVEEKTNYDGQGLKGALWTLAGTGIATVAQKFVSGLANGCLAPAGAQPASAVAQGMNAVNSGIISELIAKNAKLEAEKYSDNAAKEEANRLLQNYLKPYGDEIAAGLAREAKMQAEIECLKKTQELKEQLLQKDIELARQEARNACERNGMAIAALANTIQGVTKVVVPNTSICPGWGTVTITPAAATTSTTAAAA